MAISPRKMKELTALSQAVFEKVVGDPPNENYKFNGPEEMLFFHSVLTQMIIGYVNHVGEPYRKSKPIGRILMSVHCPRCDNEKIGINDTFCMLCGLPLTR
jgi:hypothetical protein